MRILLAATAAAKVPTPKEAKTIVFARHPVTPVASGRTPAPTTCFQRDSVSLTRTTAAATVEDTARGLELYVLHAP